MRFNLYSRPGLRRGGSPVAAAALGALVAGCGGGSAADENAPRTPREALIRAACQGGSDKVLRMAVAAYE